jgi:NTP pyrophosphatase (non-canonical NTP hydrolase)
MDATTTIEHLKREAVRFRDARDWKQFHDPKNLSIGLSVEAGELLELFLWKTPAEVDSYLSSAAGRERLSEEMADVLVFLLYVSEACGIDLSEAVRNKIALNEMRYPRGKSAGSSKKYDEL